MNSRADAEPGFEEVAGRALAGLLGASHLVKPGELARAVAEAARPLGVSSAQVYLADLEQRSLVPLPAADGQAEQAQETLPIDSTLAGRAFQAVALQSVRSGPDCQLWIPLVDGAERLGVLGLIVADVSEASLVRYRTLAALAGMIIGTKGGYSDTYPQVQRSRRMALQAELVWALLPPLTFATERVLVCGTLEPAYEAGGDAFDYALLGDHMHVSIFDAIGHNLTAGLLASVSLASCRSTRRAGGSLTDIAAGADQAIARQFGEARFVTALLCDLDLTSGLLSWVPCGHPPPLLVRGNRTVRELDRRPQPPLGLACLPGLQGEGTNDDEEPALPCTERLEPGDRVILYTDGVTEGRATDGTPFGLRRLADFIIGQSAMGLPAAETMRRLNHAIVDYQDGRLRDDATAVLVEWEPDHVRPRLFRS